MKTLFARVAALLSLLAAFASSAAPAADGPATAVVKSANETVRKSIEKMSKAKGSAYEKARADARDSVSKLLDFEQVAEDTLGKRWAGLKAPERKRYIEAVRGAMEASYLSKMQGKLAVDSVKVEYLGEEPRGERTLVKTKFTYGEDTLALGFVVAKAEKTKKARAVDVLTEDVSLVATYKDQINTLWGKKGFEGVVKAFENKRKRFEADLKEKNEGPAAKP